MHTRLEEQRIASAMQPDSSTVIAAAAAAAITNYYKRQLQAVELLTSCVPAERVCSTICTALQKILH
jgi:hypothetical protein